MFVRCEQVKNEVNPLFMHINMADSDCKRFYLQHEVFPEVGGVDKYFIQVRVALQHIFTPVKIK